MKNYILIITDKHEKKQVQEDDFVRLSLGPHDTNLVFRLSSFTRILFQHQFLVSQ